MPRIALGTPGRLVTVSNSAGAEMLILLLRRVGDDPALAEWDRRQNYARFVGPDKLVLECVIATEPPRAMIELHRRQKKTVADEVERGLLRMGVPLAMLGTGAQLELAVRMNGAHVELLVDGIVHDEEWPTGSSQQGAIIAAVAGSAEFVADLPGAPPPLTPLAQYWTPPGHNTWFGDVMLTADGERLHLFWLTDRRMGTAKFGCGGCSFAHASTTDLKHWEHHPLAWPLNEYWEAANGTGCGVVKDGVHYLFANVLTERLGLEAQYPNGPYLATSHDGIDFKKEGRAHGLPGEPGMLRDDRGVWHAISVSRHDDGVWRSSRYESHDLRQWRLADPDFLPQPGWPVSRTVFSSECFNWFRMGEWFYILGGRTGFWRARQLLGPYRSVHAVDGPSWDLYDGLMVPQVAVWKNRAILGGWLPLHTHDWTLDWGGHLVLRELTQLSDGNLELRRLPELEPPAEQRLRLRLAPLEARGSFGIHWADGGSVMFDPNQRTASSGEYTIYNVAGLDAPFTLDIVIHPDAKSDSTIVDINIGDRRTLITRRPGANARLLPFTAENCRIETL